MAGLKASAGLSMKDLLGIQDAERAEDERQKARDKTT